MELQGTVKFFDDTKGFGFITSDQLDKDIFVHISGLSGVDTLSDGQAVSFETEEGRKGLNAVNVKAA